MRLEVDFRYTSRKGLLWSTCKCLGAAWLLLAASLCAAQGGGFSTIALTQSPGNIPRLLPNAPVVICAYPGIGGTPCTNLASTWQRCQRTESSSLRFSPLRRYNKSE